MTRFIELRQRLIHLTGSPVSTSSEDLLAAAVKTIETLAIRVTQVEVERNVAVAMSEGR